MPLLNKIFEVLIQYLVEFNGEYLLFRVKKDKIPLQGNVS